MVCSRGGLICFGSGGGCATAASCRCLAGRSDRRRPPLCPWDRGDGGRPQRVSSEARPARPSHSFRASTRREHRRAQGIWAGIDPAARPSGRRPLLRASRRRSEAARPSAAVNAAKRFCLPHTQQRGHRRSCNLVSRFLRSIAGDHRRTIPFFAGGRVTYRQYLHKVATSTCGGRAVASSSRGFHASSSGSVVPLAEKERSLISRGFR